MRGVLLRKLFLSARNTHFSHKLKPTTSVISYGNQRCKHITEKATLVDLFPSRVRFFSSQDGSSDPEPNSGSGTSVAPLEVKNKVTDSVEDVKNEDLKAQVEDYLNNFNEDALPDVFESILRRGFSGKHEDTDGELLEELQIKPLEKVDDEEFESDFDELHETDDEVEDLYNARDIVVKKMTAPDGGKQSIYMNEMKWDDMIKEAVGHGYLKDTRECEVLLEDMLQWDKLLPDEIKKKVEKKFNEIGDRVEKGDLEVEEGYALFKEFEDKLVLECTKLMVAEKHNHLNGEAVTKGKKELDDPPGEGPILRWQTRVVLSPGGDAWHPKNRKVKLAVTVKELGFSKHQFFRFRELVGKRYDIGRDELTITSERFEHREENRKDCLRTLFNLIEEAGKARKLVEEARIVDVKNRLKANPMFKQRLLAKKEMAGI